MISFSEFEILCENMVGKTVRVTFKDGGTPITGYCEGFVRAIDNDPEVAQIDVISQGISYGLLETEIQSIEEV